MHADTDASFTKASAAGLRFVYVGNLPGRVGRWENTFCPACGELLVERFGYRILKVGLGADGVCLKCRATIPGVWGKSRL